MPNFVSFLLKAATDYQYRKNNMQVYLKRKGISSESTFFTLVMEEISLSSSFPGKLSRLRKKMLTC